MNLKFLKENKILIIISALIVAVYAYTTFNGIAYWQSSGVESNSTYSHTGGVHHVYGTGFYHK